MSLLRDGLHRRALLTARCGVARAGAVRLGWTPGQDDFEGLTREIKSNPGLTGVGPRYVWTERYRHEAPFGNVEQNIVAITGFAGTFTLSSTAVLRTTTFKGQFTLASEVLVLRGNVFGNLSNTVLVTASWTFTDV